MKLFVAIGMLVLVLSLCNLMGRRSANNSNSNTSVENSNAPESEQSPPPLTGAAPPGVRTLTANQNSAASEPPPPPKQTKPTPRLPPISGGVLNGKATKLVQPPYPPIARAAHASGQVTVQVVIDENGDVTEAHAVSGHPLLQAAAIAAARQSKFTPTKLAGQPVRVSGVVIYNFVEQ